MMRRASALGDAKYVALKPIDMVVRRLVAVGELADSNSGPALMVDNSYVASLCGCQLCASGDTRAEAVEALQEMIISLHELLAEFPDALLGKGMAETKVYLQAHVARREGGDDADED